MPSKDHSLFEAFSCFFTTHCNFLFYASAQDEQFSGQNKIANCEVIMKTSDKWKDSLANQNFADSLKDVELVWIYIDKQTRKTMVPNPQRVYLFNELLPNGKRVTYLVPSEIYKTHPKTRTDEIIISTNAGNWRIDFQGRLVRSK